MLLTIKIVNILKEQFLLVKNDIFGGDWALFFLLFFLVELRKTYSTMKIQKNSKLNVKLKSEFFKNLSNTKILFSLQIT